MILDGDGESSLLVDSLMHPGNGQPGCGKGLSVIDGIRLSMR